MGALLASRAARLREWRCSSRLSGLLNEEREG
jgi:hypothetical protein